jgi:hypothetical protein
MTLMKPAQTPFQHIGLFGRPETEGLGAPIRRIIATARQAGAKVAVESKTAASAGLSSQEAESQTWSHCPRRSISQSSWGETGHSSESPDSSPPAVSHSSESIKVASGS